MSDRQAISISLALLLQIGPALRTHGQEPPFVLRANPVFEYFMTSLNGYSVYVDPEFFYSEMPKVLDFADVDSTRKQEMRKELQTLSDRRSNCSDRSHMDMKGDWKSVFARFLANNLLHNGQMFHIAHERSGRIVPEIWYVRRMKTAHGPGRYTYFADKDHKIRVFTLKVRRGGRPGTRF